MSNKFNARKTEYKGRLYDSKREAQYAQELELLKKGRAIKDYEPQFRIKLVVNRHPICSIIVDFLVTMATGQPQLHEVKGRETAVWRIKWKLLQALFWDKYEFIIIK